MAVIAIVDIRNPGESARKTSAHLIASLHPLTPRFGAARHLQDAVIYGETHHGIDVVRVERIQ